MTRLQDNLARLLAQLDGHTTPDASGGVRDEEGARAVAWGVPLSHTTSVASLREILEAGGQLLSQDQLRSQGVRPPARTGSPPPVEPVLDTTDFVFTFASPLRYPGKACGFLFKITTEGTQVTPMRASPFDTGGIVRVLKKDLPPDQQREYHRQYELPVPDYRSYLQKSLEKLFHSPWHYVDGTGPLGDGPDPILAHDPRSWTFEVRFKERVPLTGNLEAVFVPVDLLDKSWFRSFFEECESDGVPVEPYLSHEGGQFWRAIEEASIGYTRKILGAVDA